VLLKTKNILFREKEGYSVPIGVKTPNPGTIV
jgi:hypothetical protein